MTTRDGTWLQPSLGERGLRGYLHTLRERRWLIVLAVAITTGLAVAYVATAEKVYEAEAGILVTPVPPDAELLISLGLPSRSADPLRDVQTVAQLVATNEVAERVEEQLGDSIPEASGGAEAVLEHLTAEPVAESNIVAVTANASTAEDAAELANAFAEATVATRTAEFHSRIDGQIAALQARLEANPEERGQIDPQVARLELLRTGDDPTLQIAARATRPDSPVAPRPLLSIVGGLLAGLVIGIGAAFGYQTLDPRLRREDQLRSAFRLPILARIPKESSGLRSGRRPISPHQLSPAAFEAYRSLRAMLGPGTSENAPRTVLVTSASAAEGKTTTAINLAASLVLTGRRVILIDGDLRNPQIGAALGIKSETGVASVLFGEATLDEAVVTTRALGSHLKVLLAEESTPWVSDIFSLATARELVTAAQAGADYVIIDSAPLSEVIDALPLAQIADEVLIVVRLGQTNLRQVVHLGELFLENGITPAGFAVVGVPQVSKGYYYVDARAGEARAPARPRRPTRAPERG